MSDLSHLYPRAAVSASPAVAEACAELGRLAREVQAWARYVERGEAVAGPDECDTLRALVRAVHRAAERVADVAAAERDQDRALPDGWTGERTPVRNPGGTPDGS